MLALDGLQSDLGEAYASDDEDRGVRYNVRSHHLLIVLLALSGGSFGTKERPHLPCEYSGRVSRKYSNTAFAMPSDLMKRRATKQVDLAAPAKQHDFRGYVGVDVLVGPDGSVVCSAGSYGHPMVVKDVEEAVRHWKFKPLKENDKAVAYVGRLDFALCNVGCTEAGFSMTLLNGTVTPAKP